MAHSQSVILQTILAAIDRRHEIVDIVFDAASEDRPPERPHHLVAAARHVDAAAGPSAVVVGAGRVGDGRGSEAEVGQFV